MPTYEYRCKSCEHEFEEFQSMTAAVLKKCPACGKSALERLIGIGAAVVFKGSGFYQTDYRSESYKKAAEADKPSDTTSGDSKGGDAKAPQAGTSDTSAPGAKGSEAKTSDAKPAESGSLKSKSSDAGSPEAGPKPARRASVNFGNAVPKPAARPGAKPSSKSGSKPSVKSARKR